MTRSQRRKMQVLALVGIAAYLVFAAGCQVLSFWREPFTWPDSD